MSAHTVIAVLVGQPRTEGRPGAEIPMERVFRSAIFKEPVEGPVWLGREGLKGDGWANERHHGGPDQAVCAYVADHFPLWNAEFSGLRFSPGAFGENFSITGLTEQTVAIGDTFDVGEARVQITKPRLPCATLARRWKMKDFPARVLATERTGWYMRVLREGHIEAGQAMEPIDRPHPEWTIARACGAYLNRGEDRRTAAELASVPELDEAWQRQLAPKSRI
jgi:MOSC domain-containing protein YiiM